MRQPAGLALAGSVAALLIVAGLVLHRTKPAVRQEAIVADAVAPRPPAANPLSAAPLNTTEPRLVGRNPKRLAGLPAGRAGPAPQPVAVPPPSPHQAVGGLGGAAEDQGRAVQSTPVPVLSLNSGARLPMASGRFAKAASGAVAKPAVSYNLLLRDAGGAYSAVPSATVFHAGDSVRLQIEPGEDGYIYLFQRGAGWNLVTSQPVEKGQSYELPSMGGLQSDVPAQLEFLLALSREEQKADADVLALKAQASVKITLEYR
jgi:hypothetical protein